MALGQNCGHQECKWGAAKFHKARKEGRLHHSSRLGLIRWDLSFVMSAMYTGKAFQHASSAAQLGVQSVATYPLYNNWAKCPSAKGAVFHEEHNSSKDQPEACVCVCLQKGARMRRVLRAD